MKSKSECGGDVLNVSDNITGIGKLYGKEVKKNNVSFMKTERLGVDFKLASSKFKIKDYLNGNNVLGEMSRRGFIRGVTRFVSLLRILMRSAWLDN